LHCPIAAAAMTTATAAAAAADAAAMQTHLVGWNTLLPSSPLSDSCTPCVRCIICDTLVSNPYLPSTLSIAARELSRAQCGDSLTPFRPPSAAANCDCRAR
jgi:hypothetical protein